MPIFSWIECPDRAARDAANKKMGEDPASQNMEVPFDGKARAASRWLSTNSFCPG